MADSVNQGEPTPEPSQALKPPEELKKRETIRPSPLPSMIVGVVVAAVAALSIWYLVRGEPLLVQGEVDAARVDGRVAEIPVIRGQNVDAGAVLVRIDNPETLAKNNQASAAKIVASGTHFSVFNAWRRPGINPPTITLSPSD